MPDHHRLIQHHSGMDSPVAASPNDYPMSLVVDRRQPEAAHHHHHQQQVQQPQAVHHHHPQIYPKEQAHLHDLVAAAAVVERTHSGMPRAVYPQRYQPQDYSSPIREEVEEAPLALVVNKQQPQAEDMSTDSAYSSSGHSSPTLQHIQRGGQSGGGQQFRPQPFHRSDLSRRNSLAYSPRPQQQNGINNNKTVEQPQQQQQEAGKLSIRNFAKVTDTRKTSTGSLPVSSGETPSSMDSASVASMSESCGAGIDLTKNNNNATALTNQQLQLPKITQRKSSNCSSGVTMHACDYCDRTFANKYHLQSHLVTHTGERSFACTDCGKTFGRKSTLRAHMTTHTKTSNFMCPICSKACNDNNSLEEHIRMHTGEKPFVCEICSKSYARKSHLNVHYRVHTGERPFVCGECGKDFTEKRFLNDHAQTAHGKTSAQLSQESANGGQPSCGPKVENAPLRCPNCNREFAYKTSLKQHLKKQMCIKNLNRGLIPNVKPGDAAAEAIIKATSAVVAKPQPQVQQEPSQVPITTPQPHLLHLPQVPQPQQQQPPQQQQVMLEDNANMSVSGGSSTNGCQNKAFKCPFCEKAYSWKQTLKQHVSMYHRDKVHTEEFWKYELTKHRRQNGTSAQPQSLESCGASVITPSEVNAAANDEAWKRQLGKHAADIEGQDSSFTNEGAPVLRTLPIPAKVKQLASKLQEEDKEAQWQRQIEACLQNSKHQQEIPQQVIHVAVKKKANKDKIPEDLTVQASAMERTRLWLDQLDAGSPPSMEIEDETSQNALIVEEQPRHHIPVQQLPQQPLPQQPLPQQPPPQQQPMMVPLMSALQVKQPERSQEQQKQSEQQQPQQLLVDLSRSSCNQVLSKELPRVENPTFKMPEAKQPKDSSLTSSESFLKQMLLDPAGARKRISSEEYSQKPKPKAPKMENAEAASTDFLRKRLLGIKETPAPQQKPVLKPVEEKPVEQKPVSPPPPSPPKTVLIEKDFATKSVLKHLLHRYEATAAEGTNL